MSQPIAYLNGQFIPAERACLPVWDAGVVQGATVSETLRTFAGRLFRLDAHLARLADSARYVGFDLPIGWEALAEAAVAVAEHNYRLLADEAREGDAASEAPPHAAPHATLPDDLGMVVFLTAGPYATYAPAAGAASWRGCTACVHTFPLPFELWAQKLRDGQHLATPSVRGVPPECYDPRIKCRSRMHYFLADRQARALAPEASALLLDREGRVTETNAANFLLVRQGRLVSPPRRRILAGITLTATCELAASLGLDVVEQDLYAGDLRTADEALTTSTPYGVMPVAWINGAPVGDGKPGPQTRQLMQAWNRLVGLDIAEQMEHGARRRADRGRRP